jgi:hypothetical protein
MDVIGFVCVSLGSSTVQVYDSLNSSSHSPVQWLVSVVKLATKLEECTRSIEEQRSVVLFLLCGQMDSLQRIFIKNFFFFTVGSVCRVKRDQP